jgi:hypothetical protein
VGASYWEYVVAYQEDLQQALQQLRSKVFDERDYYWVKGADWRSEDEREPWPTTIEELWQDEWVQYSGTHSVLDILRVIAPEEEPDDQTVRLVSAHEARQALGVEKLTRAHMPKFDVFESARWMGRCAILHDDQGQPQEICFWGHSGD